MLVLQTPHARNQPRSESTYLECVVMWYALDGKQLGTQ
jgi:hypothetical protein